MTHFNVIDWIAMILVTIGALNWGLVGLFGFSVVTAIVGDIPLLENAIYAIVGVAGLWLVYLMARATTTTSMTS